MLVMCYGNFMEETIRLLMSSDCIFAHKRISKYFKIGYQRRQMLRRQSIFKHFVRIILLIIKYTNSNYFYLVISNLTSTFWGQKVNLNK